MRVAALVGIGIGLWMIGCGGAAPAQAPKAAEEAAPEAAESEPKSDEAAEEKADADSPLPTKCAKAGDICTPSHAFMKRLCESSFPGVALVMFSGGTPWTRGYVSVQKVEPVNAFGGVAGGENLVFDEEVILLFVKSGDLNGMQVSGAGSYQVLRWDGTCATLASEEVRLQRPGSPKHAKVNWRFLDDKIKEALRTHAKLDEVVRAHRKECKGATMGEVSAKCEKLDKQLASTIVEVVRSGSVKLPEPEKLP
jgi:hypothetical protein